MKVLALVEYKQEMARGVKKTIIFGLLEHNGKVHTEIVTECFDEMCQKVIRGWVILENRIL